jgi:magnesium transporter
MKTWKTRDRHLHLPQRVWSKRPRIRPGTLPGTLVPPEETRPPARVSVMRFSHESFEEREASTVDDAAAMITSGGVTWINVDGLDAAVLTRLGERFGLHPLALEDAMNVPQRPKAERYDKHYFLVLRSIRHDAGLLDEQVSVFFGEGWVITIQERIEGDSFGSVRAAIRQGRGRTREAGADYLAYLLLEAVVDAYFPVVEWLSERMGSLEQEAIASTASTTCLLAIQHVRHDLLTLRRAVWPMREEVGALMRDESHLVAPETRVFLRDAYDHAVQALEIVESLRETAPP